MGGRAICPFLWKLRISDSKVTFSCSGEQCCPGSVVLRVSLIETNMTVLGNAVTNGAETGQK